MSGTHSRGRANTRLLLRLLIVIACLAALTWTVARLGPGQVYQVARRADPLWLILSPLPIFGRFLIWGFKWRRILGRRHPVPYGLTLRILIAGSFVNLTTPTAKLAGGLLRASFIDRRYGWGLAAAYGRALVDQATNATGTTALYGILALTVFFALPDLTGRAAFGASGALVLAAVAAFIALRPWGWRQVQRPWLRRLLERITPARFRGKASGGPANWIQPIFYPLLGEGSRLTLASDILLGAVGFAPICLANAMVVRALGIEANLWMVSAVVVVSYFASITVGTWGGIGVTEAAMTGLYVQFGIPVEQAMAAALLHRAGLYLIVLVWGGLSLPRETRTRPSNETETG